MLNKKLLAIASIIATLSASASYAKTEGGYVGVDISRYSVTDKYPSPEDTQVSPAFGINAKYAINFDKVFIAPGIFADFNNTDKKDIGFGYSEKISVKNRYGEYRI